MIPDSCSAGAVLLHKYTKLPLPTNLHSVTILDSPNGKSRSYKLPDDCFAIAQHARDFCPTIDIELLNKEGQSLGSKIKGWQQVISAQNTGEEDFIIFNSEGGQGSQTLLITSTYSRLFLSGLTQFPLQRNKDSRDPFIYVPSLTGWCNTGPHCAIIFTASAVFPYRFRLDASETSANPQPTVSVSVGGPVKIDSN